MKKFSLILERKIDDLPDYWQDVLGYIELYEETNDVLFTQKSVGFMTKYNIDNKTAVQSMPVISGQKLKSILHGPDRNQGTIETLPDKWVLVMRLNIGFEALEQNFSYSTDKMSSWGRMEDRMKSIKTLINRISKWCDTVKISTLNNQFYGSNIKDNPSQKPDVSILFVFK